MPQRVTYDLDLLIHADSVARRVALAGESDLAAIRVTVARWQPEDLADFESLVVLGKLGMGA